MSYHYCYHLPFSIYNRHFSLQSTSLFKPHPSPALLSPNKHISQSITHSINQSTTMEAIKNAIGLGSTTTTTEQQGREPVNGVTGSGVAGEPYDQGNAEGM